MEKIKQQKYFLVRKRKAKENKRRLKAEKAEIKVLEKQADKLYQEVFIKLKPNSIISGERTEVIHHFVPKSQSNTLRYDKNNGIPLTNKEHANHHLSGDPTIVVKILGVNGQGWFDSLSIERRRITKFTKDYLEGIIKELNSLV